MTTAPFRTAAPLLLPLGGEYDRLATSGPRPKRRSTRAGAVDPSNAPRRDSVPDFFDHLREWSRWKQFVQKGYQPQFAKITGRGERTNWIEGFAGEGSYGDGTPGSPLLTARLARELALREAGKVTLRCFNYERDPGAYAALERATDEFDPEMVINRNEAFGPDAARRVVAEIGPEPALFFLDPFGIEGLEWETLCAIGRRPRTYKTELMINFNVPKLDRHAGWLDSRAQPAQRAFLELVERVWPRDDGSWRRIVTSTTDSRERYDRLCKAYMAALRDRFGFFVVRFPVRTQDTGALKYYLLHATRSPTALLIVWQIYYSAHRHYAAAVKAYQDSRPGPRPLPLFAPLSDEEREECLLKYLERDVARLGCLARRISIFDLQLRLMDPYFGRVAVKHFRRACGRLIERKVIDRPAGPRGIQWREPLRFVA